MGTKWSRWALNGPDGAQKPIFELMEGFTAWITHPFRVPKWLKKSIKKPFKKTVVFRSGLGRDFLGFFYPFPPQNGAKMEPGGYQNRYKNRFWSKQRVFVLM